MSDTRRHRPAEEEPLQDDFAWLVEAQGPAADQPHPSAAASREEHYPFDQGLTMLPELNTLRHISVPASASGTFSAAASSPTALRPQGIGLEPQATFTPPVSRLITTGLRSRALAAEQPTPGQEPPARLRRAASESTTGTPGASESPAARGGRPPRARSVKEEAERGQDPGASAQPAESPGVYRSLRKRPNLNYAQAAGDEDSDSDASSSPASEEEGKKAAPKQQATEPRKGQRGRKRRTEPIVVMKEDGTREEVSPQAYRRLRRRVTNRLSARRMRQKRAEEREAVAQETSNLQQENAALRARMSELESANRGLAREAYTWRTRYEQLTQRSGRPSSAQQQQQQQQQGSYVSPAPNSRSHSMPTPHQLPDPLQPQQGSISPGGYEQFSLSDNFPSLHVLSPPPPQQTSSLSRQQLPPFDMSTRQLAQRLQSGRSTMGLFAPMQLQPGSSPDIPTPQMEREQLRSSQVGPLFSGGFTHLSPPFPGSPVQGDAPQSREAGFSIERSLRVRSPRHSSAPNLSQEPSDFFASPPLLDQRRPPPGMAFGGQQHALDLVSYGQPGLPMGGAFAQPSQRPRSSAGMKLGERSSAPGIMGHLGSGSFDHMPMPDRDDEL